MSTDHTPLDPELARLIAEAGKARERAEVAARAAEGTPKDSPERRLLRERQAELVAAERAEDAYSLPGVPWIGG
jgi:hypothetical protein